MDPPAPPSSAPSTSATPPEKERDGTPPQAKTKTKTDPSPARDVRNLYVSSMAYNVLTLTDGAIRIVVLLYFVQFGFSALALALMFSLYELAGVVFNLAGGMLGATFGMRWLLLSSIALQVAGVVMLAPLQQIFPDPTSDVASVTAYVIVAQGLSGASKDLMKIQGKSVPKLCTKPGDDDRLFRVIAVLTGMKNTLKGFGYLLGALLLWGAGWVVALCVQAGLLVLVLPFAVLYMERDLGLAPKERANGAKVTCAVFRKGWNVNVLSLARIFLFGARDVWFEVPLPYFFRKVIGWAPYSVGVFMGGFIVVYGQLQAWSSELFSPKRKCGFKRIPNRTDVPRWAFANAVETLALGIGAYFAYEPFTGAAHDAVPITAVLIVGIFVFAALFAVNSAVHSYLIVFYSEGDKVSMDVGFYYMASAIGRFVGTIGGGAIYQYTYQDFGLAVCLWVGTAALLVAGAVSVKLRDVAPKPKAVAPKTQDAATNAGDAGPKTGDVSNGNGLSHTAFSSSAVPSAVAARNGGAVQDRAGSNGDERKGEGGDGKGGGKGDVVTFPPESPLAPV